jgi:hypothetical protein
MRTANHRHRKEFFRAKAYCHLRFERLAQNGRGVKRAPQRESDSFTAIGARSRALCALVN